MSRKRENHTLGATALINEVYLRLIDNTKVQWQNRAQFIGVCAPHPGRIRSLPFQNKGGGGLFATTLDESAIASQEKSTEVIAIHEALERFETLYQRKSRVVELRQLQLRQPFIEGTDPC